ncbi:MAG TPA: hypothetical protein VMX35_03605 [Acidobacteriota bacterium]|nr:hypothetical protein [Acidobacteriota bacterium]
MSLKDLEEKGFLEKIPTDRNEIGNLISLAEGHLADTRVEGLRTDSVLIHAYEAARTLALVALRSCGYRPRTGTAAHVVTIDSLLHTVGVERNLIAQLHTLKNKRHRNIYDAAGATTRHDADEAVACAENLKVTVLNWLGAQNHHPDE